MGCYCVTKPPPPRISLVALQRPIDDNVQCLLLTSGDEHIPHQSMHALDVPHPPGCVKQRRGFHARRQPPAQSPLTSGPSLARRTAR